MRKAKIPIGLLKSNLHDAGTEFSACPEASGTSAMQIIIENFCSFIMPDNLPQEYLANRYYSGYVEKKGFLSRIQKLLYFRFLSRMAKKTKKGIILTMRGMGQEGQETKEMAKSFFRLLESKLDIKNRKTPPTPEEVKEAIEQLKDIGRFSVFASISIIPGGGFSLIGLEILARKFGMKKFTFVPSAFRKNEKDGNSPKENNMDKPVTSIDK